MYSKHIQIIKTLEIPKQMKFELKKMHYTCKSRAKIKGFSFHNSMSNKRYFFKANAPILKFIDLKLCIVQLRENEFFSFTDVLGIRNTLIDKHKNLFPKISPEKSKLCIEIMSKSIGRIERFECSIII